MIVCGCQEAAKTGASPLESHIKAAFPNASIVSTKSKLKHWTTVHEAKLTEGGKELEVTLSKEGEVLKVETKVDLSDVPKPVADAITAAAKDGKILEVEKIERRATIKDGKAVKLDKPETYYEAEYCGKLGLKSEIKLAPDGTRRTHQASPQKA
jgi:hypothetical protein